MPRYIFAKGKVTVEEGIYTPLLPDTRPSRSGVLIFARPAQQNQPTAFTQKKEQQSHVSE